MYKLYNIKNMSDKKKSLKINNYVNWYLNKCVNSNFKINTNESKVNYEFIEWIEEIENYIILNFGFTLIDLPDEDYIFYFENNYTPEMMIKIILNSNGL